MHLHMSETLSMWTSFQWTNNKATLLLLQPSIRPVPAQVILLWKGPPKLCIECHLVPLWAFPQKSPGSIRSLWRYIIASLETWQGKCYRNKGECYSNQSNINSFVQWVAKNDSGHNGNHHKFHNFFLIDSFVLVITLVWRTVHSLSSFSPDHRVFEFAVGLELMPSRADNSNVHWFEQTFWYREH